MNEIVENSVGMKFVKVAGGSNQPGIYFAQFLMSNREFQRITGQSRPWWAGNDSDPVNRLNWFDTVELSRILSNLSAERSAGRRYRLPTVEEWQRVCSAETGTRFFFGDNPDELSRFAHVGSEDSLQASGRLMPNPWGIYDLYGNLWEWCTDPRQDESLSTLDLNDLRPDNLRTLCGGAWCTSPGSVSSWLVDFQHPSAERSTIGVRLLFTVETPDSITNSNRPASILKGLHERQLINSIGMSLTPIPAQRTTSTIMADAAKQSTLSNSEDAGYYIGTFPVTEAEYRLLSNGGSYALADNYSFQTDLGRVPVTGVSWKEADEFCVKLSEIPDERNAGRRYRLPTESEWEYCCCCGEPVNAMVYKCSARTAWTSENTRRNTHPPVGLKEPNSWGLHDMLGSVSEWCSNYFFEREPQDRERIRDPFCRRVARGGNVYFLRSLCQPNSRFPVSMNRGSLCIGFRVLMYIEVPKS